jgi:glycosyltransferase involved in cell wall biosynthesis
VPPGDGNFGTGATVKILFLNPVGTVGGAERVLLDLIASLRAAVPSAELHLVTAAAGPLVEAGRALGAATQVLPLPASVGALGDSGLGLGQGRAALAAAGRAPAAAWAAWRYGGRLRRLVEDLRPDVVHSNGIKCHLLTRLARLRGTPVVWHVHDFLGRRPLMARGLRWASGAAAGAVAISRAVAEDARTVLRSVPVAVVANGIDTGRFTPGPGDGARLDRLAGLPAAGPEVVRVGLVATFARWKGQEVFLRAAERVGDLVAGRAVRFYVVGGPIYQTRGSQWSEDELRRQGAGLLAAGRLGFAGFQDETAAVYRALDVVVHASTQPEPFGLTIAEAMACGRAVIVARAGGAAELFTPGHDAVGVPPGDAEALARAIAELVGDPDRRQRLGEQARASAVERFRREHLGPEVLAAYRRFGVRAAAVPGAPAEAVRAGPRSAIQLP